MEIYARVLKSRRIYMYGVLLTAWKVGLWAVVMTGDASELF